MKLTERKLLELEHDIRYLYYGSRALSSKQIVECQRVALNVARNRGYDVDQYLKEQEKNNA